MSLVSVMMPFDLYAVDDMATADLGEIDRQLNNPLTSIWSLTFQNNTSAKEGSAIDGTEYTNNLFFQPFMPFEVGAKK
jgi:predicted outer membrane repeat protein